MAFSNFVLTEVESVADNVVNNSSDDTLIAFVALIVAVLSFVVSLVAIRQNTSINTTNLQAKYFEDIFKSYIVDRIPETVSKLEFVDGKLNHAYRDLNNVMMEMIADSKYFAYAKKDFYDELQGMTRDLEDKLITQSNKESLDMDYQKKFIYEIHMDIMEIVKFINKNYHHF